MTLQWQIVPIIFDQGLSQKTDDKSVTNKWLALENVVMEKSGKFQKRRGFTKSNLLSGATSFTDKGASMYGFPLLNDSSLRCSSFLDLGIKPVTLKFSRAVYCPTIATAAYSLDNAAGTTCEFHLRGYDDNGVIAYDLKIYNLDTSAPRLSKWVGTSTAVVGGFYKTGSGVGADMAVQSGNSFVNIATNVTFDNLSAFAATRGFTSAVFVVYSDKGAGNTKVLRYNQSLNAVDFSATIAVDNKATAVSSDGTYVYVVVDKTLYRYNFDLTGVTNVRTASTGSVVQCAFDGTFITDDGTHCYIYESRFGKEFVQYNLQCANVSPFVVNTDEIYAIMTQRQPADVSQWAGGFLVKRIDNKARSALGNNGYLDYYNDYTGSSSVGRANLETGLLFGYMSRFAGISQPVSGKCPIVTFNSVVLANFTSGTDSQSVTVGNDIVYGTSALRLYTGSISNSAISTSQSVLYGWHYSPVISSVTSGANATSLAAGQYIFYAMFEQVTSAGNIIRSVPSVPITLAAHTANKDISVTIKCPIPEGVKVLQSSLVLYASSPGSTLYTVCQTSTGETRHKITESVTLSITSIGDEPIYITGGVLEDTPPPAYFGSLSFAKNRAWLFSAETNEIRFSDEIAPGFMPMFSEEFALAVPHGGGSGAVVKEIDGKLIAFQKYQVSATYGDGPNALGQNPFPPLQVVARDIGAIVPNSVVTTNEGIYFLSEKGLWLLDRGLTVQFVGAGVDDEASAVICGVKMTEREQIWFFTATKALIWDAYHKLWTTAPLSISGVKDAKNLGATLHVLANGDDHTLSGTSDDGSNIAVKLKTGWIQLGGPQGFHRVKTISFLTDALASTTMTVKIYHDFSTTASETFTVASANVILNGTTAQWDIKPKKQKAEAMQIEISYTGTNAGVSFSNFSMEAALKKAGFKNISRIGGN